MKKVFILFFASVILMSVSVIAAETPDVRQKAEPTTTAIPSANAETKQVADEVSVAAPSGKVLKNQAVDATAATPTPSEITSETMQKPTDKSTVAAADKPVEKAKDANIIHINSSEEFTKLVNNKAPVLIDFYADWSAPCDMINDVIIRISNKPDVKYKVAKMNIDMYHELAKEYEIKTLPTVIVFQNGKEVGRELGVQAESAYVSMLGTH